MRTIGIGALAALAALVLASGAQAAPQRLPASGTPAVTLDVPDDWSVVRLTDATVNLTNPQHSGVISVTLEVTPPDFDLTLFRDNVFKAANCRSLDREESLRIGGRAARAWYCQPQMDILAPARVALIRLDSTHVLSVSHTYRMDASGADVQGLQQVLNTARYELAP